MTRELDLEQLFLKVIAETPVGQDIPIIFGGIPDYVELTLEFPGGWVFKYKVLPGQSLSLKKGREYTPNIKIAITPYDGLSIVKDKK